MPTVEERLQALEEWKDEAQLNLIGLNGDVTKLKNAVRVLQNSALDLKDAADNQRQVSRLIRRQRRA